MRIIKFNRTKVVCTIGPACESEEVLQELILEGMDVARLNFSHGSHEVHAQNIKRIRGLNERLDTQVAILQDLQGPKIRIGALDAPFAIKEGDELFLRTDLKKRDGNMLPIQYATFAKDVKAGDLILVDDGKVYLTVLETDKETTVKLKVLHGDEINSKKGVNLPYTTISLPSITEKDWADLEFGLTQDVDWIALSFVRTPGELRVLKNRIREAGSHAKVIAKIEKPEALKNIDEIIAETDAIMVARGDLGVEIPLEEVPKWQKLIIQKCNKAAKPVIVATQMMESMIDNRRPTRAETADVANAVLDGADAVMLSGETSVGKFPVEVVRSMNKIIASMEQMDEIYYHNMDLDASSGTFLNDAINNTACRLSQETHADAIVGMTVSGYTAFMLAKCRPKANIFIFTRVKEMIPVFNLIWGVRSFFYDKSEGTNETIHDLKEILKDRNLVKQGDIIINTGTMPLNAQGRTNMVKIGVVD